jgi:aminopeptidase YwaD
MRKYLLLLFILIHSQCLFGQNVHYAQSVIDTLTSPTMAGRGYNNDGLQKASDFIKNEFIKAGIDGFTENYLQEFTIPMNIIKNTVIQKGKLKPAEDYYVNIMSGSGSGRFKVFIADESIFANRASMRKFIQTDHSDFFILFPPSVNDHADYKDYVNAMTFSGQKQAAGFIQVTQQEISWHVYMFGKPLDVPLITIKENDKRISALKKIHINISTEFFPEFPVSNVCGYIPGTEHPDSFIVFCAHYDHLGMMGDVIFPGANDNASGVAMMLDLMHYFNSKDHRLPYSVVFLAFTAEEAGILGASYFVENPLIDLEAIRFLINLDLVGTGREGIQIVNGSVFTNEFNVLKQINNQHDYLPEIKTRGEACNSDHCPFHMAGVPSFFIYTLDSEYPWYHVPQDKAEKLPLTGYEGLFRLLVDFSKEISSH